PPGDPGSRERSFRMDGMVGAEGKRSWDEFHALPFEDVPCDIDCVTSWSKLGTTFRGVSLDTFFEQAEPLDAYSMVHSFGGFTTNLAIEGLTDGKPGVVTQH